MDEPPLIDRVCFAIACYGVALLFVAEGLWCPPGVVGDLWTLITCPVSGAMIGVGTGDLYGRRWLGAMIGFASGLLIQLVISYSLAAVRYECSLQQHFESDFVQLRLGR